MDNPTTENKKPVNAKATFGGDSTRAGFSKSIWRIQKSGSEARGIRSGNVRYRKRNLGKVEESGYRTKRERTFGIKLGNANAQDTAPPATHRPKKTPSRSIRGSCAWDKKGRYRQRNKISVEGIDRQSGYVRENDERR